METREELMVEARVLQRRCNLGGWLERESVIGVVLSRPAVTGQSGPSGGGGARFTRRPCLHLGARGRGAMAARGSFALVAAPIAPESSEGSGFARVATDNARWPESLSP